MWVAVSTAALTLSCGAAKTPETQGSTSKTLSSAECEQAGGQVVGDIGDGAIHAPGYRCPGSGAAPLGTIRDEGGPIAVEGAVCCPG